MKMHFTGNDSDHAPGGFYAGDDSLIPMGTGIDVEDEQDMSEASKRQNKIADCYDFKRLVTKSLTVVCLFVQSLSSKSSNGIPPLVYLRV